MVKDIFDNEITVYLIVNSKKRSLVVIMTLKKLHEKRHLFPVLGNSKSQLRKAILKHDLEMDSIISYLGFV